MRLSRVGYLLCAGLSVGVALGCASPAAAPAPTRPGGAAPTAAAPAPAAQAPTAPAAASQSAPAAAPAPVATVRLAYLPIISHAVFFLGWEKGYWREAGVEVEGTEFGGSDQAMPFLANGQLDVAGGSSGAGFLNALYQGVSSRIVASLSGVSPDGFTGAALMVRRDEFESGRLTSPADLRGKRVAVNGKGVYGEFVTDRHLRQGGLTIEDVDMVILGIPDMLAGLAGGSVDAADLIEPAVTQAQDRGIAVPIARAGADPNGQSQVLLYGEHFVRDNPEGARRFLVGYLRALRDLARTEFKDPGDAATIAKYTKLPTEIVLRAVPPYVEPNGRVNVAHLDLQQRFFAQRGYLSYGEMLDLNRFVDYTWLDQVLQQLGPYQP